MDHMGDDSTTSSVADSRSAEDKRVVAATVAASAIGWWPAFTLGVYGVIFFEQRLALWAAATSAFLAVELTGGRRVWRRVSNYALLLPSLWLVLVWLLPVTADSSVHTALFWFGVVVTLLGLPALAAFLIRLLIPESHRWHRKQAVTAMVVVFLVMLVSYGLGTQHPHMLSCNDFSISGNYAPDNCTPGITGANN